MKDTKYVPERMRHRCYGLALKMLNNSHDADDAVQNAILGFYELPNKEIENPENYLLRATRNASIDLIRKRNSYNQTIKRAQDEKSSTQDECPRSLLEKNETTQKIASALDVLPDYVRSSLTAQFYHNLSREEIAAMHNVTIYGIKSRLSRGKESLRKSLEQFDF